MKPGMSYQKEAAKFFGSLGLTAEVEKKGVQGVRGKHDIDVWVTGQLHFLEIQWVVECKDWKSNIPKEKVQALQYVVQDVGADRGWLLSEQGFQTGAVHCARLTNITLTSLKYLREETQEYISSSAAMMLLSRVTMLNEAYSRFHLDYEKRHGDYSFMGHRAMRNSVRLMFLEAAVKRGAIGEFPVVYLAQLDQVKVEATDWEDLMQAASRILKEDGEALIGYRKGFDEDDPSEVQ